MVQSLQVSVESDRRTSEVFSELQVALRQRRQINHPEIRRRLTNHIQELKAELMVLGLRCL